MIYRKDGQIYFDEKDFEILADIWEGFKNKYGHDEKLFKQKIAGWLNALPEKNKE
jgi:hypothetical protein